MGVYKTAKQTPIGLDPAVVEQAVRDLGLNTADPDLCQRLGWEQKIFSVEELVLTFLVCIYCTFLYIRSNPRIFMSVSELSITNIICATNFQRCLQELSASPKDRALLGSLSFDKDDLWAMKFVFAAANLRMHVFSILPLVSFHNCKVQYLSSSYLIDGIHLNPILLRDVVI